MVPITLSSPSAQRLKSITFGQNDQRYLSSFGYQFNRQISYLKIQSRYFVTAGFGFEFAGRFEIIKSRIITHSNRCRHSCFAISNARSVDYHKPLQGGPITYVQLVLKVLVAPLSVVVSLQSDSMLPIQAVKPGLTPLELAA